MPDFLDLDGQDSLCYRLLELWPISLIRDNTEEHGNKNELIVDILNSNNAQRISNIFFDNIALCKQHVYLFEYQGNLNFNNIPVLTNIPENFHLKSSNNSDSKLVYNFFAEIRQDFISISNRTFHSFLFYWPISVQIYAEHIRIQLVILERSSELFNDLSLETRRKTNEDSDMLETIRRLIDSNFNIRRLRRLDFNRGIKFLMDRDVIDCSLFRARKEKSLSSESMDKGCLLKQDYPDLYEDFKQRPIEKSIFKFKKIKFAFGEGFVGNPGSGELFFPRFPKLKGNIDNVVGIILRNN